MFFKQTARSIGLLGGAALLLLGLYTASFCRLARWQGGEICMADIFCLAATPREYLYPVYLLFGLFVYRRARFCLAPAFAVRAKSRWHIVGRQTAQAAGWGLSLTVWLGVCAAGIGAVVAQAPVNWHQYNSLYYLNTQTLRTESLVKVVAWFAVYSFCTLMVAAMLFALSAWAAGSPLWGGLCLTAFYLWDVTQPYERSAYFRRAGLSYDSWATGMVGAPLLFIQVGAVSALILVLILLSRKKDLIRS